MNPCEADWERRKRAIETADFTNRDGEMTRTITFEVGYDHREFARACGGGGHGQHGMLLRFMLQGSAGAVQWVINMPNWVPGNTTAFIGDVNAISPVSIVVPTNREIGDIIVMDLGYHSPKPQHKSQPGNTDCHILPEGTCYYDGSSYNAKPILVAFLEHGPGAVWEALDHYYEDIFG